MTTQPTPVDPPTLHHCPAFAHSMIVPGAPTLYVGGQNGIGGTGALFDGFEAQTEQAMRNVPPCSPRPGLAPSMLPN
jgi:hypothetical protein